MRRSSNRNRACRYYIRPGYLVQVLLITAFIILSGCGVDSRESNSDRSTVMSEGTHADNDNSTSIDITEIPQSSHSLNTPQKFVKSQQSDTIENSVLNDQLQITFLDVGQADSILISQGQRYMLIDAGNNADEELVVNYLKSKGIGKLDYVIGTHAHEDHIGGLDAVINDFEIGKVLMPKQISTTKTFEDVLVAIKNKGMKVTTPKVGDVYELGKAKWTILAPNKEKYENINNSSLVVRMTFGNNSFIFMGDAEELSEREILSNNLEIQSDLIKIGHHGSGSSTTALFLKKVSAKYAVISVGKDNSYGHPDSLILNRLKTFGVEVFRTDEIGTIVVTSDGDTIKFDKNASAIKEQAPPVESKAPNTHSSVVTSSPEKTEIKEITVYITKNEEKYHAAGCSYLRKSSIPIELFDAKNSGYTPCSRCNPPR
ncbi:MAG TPA: MBL fold metallo-hydrolase [Clostridium sp.]|nr:MBL fold metallo-hydrolase [Clostridium sp.]